ncbi:unnamed protein product [Mytilus edulis]|uniref:Sulfotransferase domain-containing protein n=1 Tax=Mytilus edulis TaxID=6550 RepID=A0A8S3SGK9_MYTED|nr:unnamed protein product [Mytilus edulis]
MQSFEADDNDVIICSYPKSGFHWIWEVVTMLLNNTSVISKELPAKYVLEAGTIKNVQQSPQPRVLGSHLYYEELPVSIREKKCKIINVIRDPRAVAVSSFHFFTKIKESKWKGTWAGYLNLFLNGKVLFNGWFQHTQLWERVRQNNPDNPIHVLSYEDAKKNPFYEFKRLSQFLQLDVKDSTIMTIAENTNFSQIKTSKKAIAEHRLGSVFVGNTYPLYRKGTEDDWKSHFTLQQNAEFEQIYKDRMQNNKMQLKSIVTPGSLDTGCVETTRYESKFNLSNRMFKTFVADGDLAGSVTVKEYEGRYFPPDMPDIPSHLKRLQSFDADASDVIICAYPKSGFHWIWDVVTMLINNTSRISKELPGKYSLELGVRKMEQIPPPRVLGSHLYYEELPASIRQKKCKIINVIRDPRAVAVSSYHFFTKIKESKWNGTWAGYLNLFLNGKVLFNDWFTYTQLWERVRQNNPSNPTHVLFYEDAIQNPFNEFKRLARFLQLDVKDYMIRTIAEQTKFSICNLSKRRLLDTIRLQEACLRAINILYIGKVQRMTGNLYLYYNKMLNLNRFTKKGCSITNCSSNLLSTRQ